MSTVLAPIIKELLVWARKTSNQQEGELAHVAGVTIDRYRNWEAGCSQPTLRQLERIANKVRIPTIVFFLEEPPNEPTQQLDYRTVTNDGQAGFLPELTLSIRKARYLQSRLSECAAGIVPGWHSVLPALQLSDNPVERAVELKYRVSGLPSVTPTAKPAVSPISDQFTGTGSSKFVMPITARWQARLFSFPAPPFG